MKTFEKYYEARDIILEILQQDLVGPVTSDECISVRPSDAYTMAKLYPRKVAASEDVTCLSTTMDNAALEADSAISLAGQFHPSSMAFTFSVSTAVEEIEITVDYARYDRAKAAPQDAESKKSPNRKPNWQRRPAFFLTRFSLEGSQESRIEVEKGLDLRVFIRREPDGKKRTVTLALVNTASYEAGRHLREENCVFQPTMEIRAANGSEPFQPLTRRSMLQNEEACNLELLYGTNECYANGHGCSVTWDMEHSAPEWIRTCFLPTFDLSQMEPSTADATVQSMQFLSRASDAELSHALYRFASDYERWAQDLILRSARLPDDLQETAAEHCQACAAAAKRIRAGVDFLCSGEPELQRAFRLANEAMLMQRERTLVRAGAPFDPAQAKWYPFQLGFFLYEISSFADSSFATDEKTPDREIADLLWFPTGGGKTEAYLGISAFVIFLRRLRNADADGVTVIMRYTMRLLTLQQFERAAIMICACEQLREKYDLGGSEISIGLWVGESLTPNKLADARKELHRAPDAPHENGNPVQIRVCPWCGAALGASNYKVDLKAKKMHIHCSNPDCAFHNRSDGLPVYLIDEAIYTHLPSFLVSTIDKFAQMPLKEETARIFGIGADKEPPNLVIQDELHLISGQLGTISGLYELAVTAACENSDGVGAKVIASTATIRGAEGQIASLYGKPCTQFPPPGLNSADLYFAHPAPADRRPTRRYAGIMAAGIQAQPTLVRVYSSLLFATRYLAAAGFPDEVVDSFWTITGYFNTIRELGQSVTQIHDEIQARFRFLASTKFKDAWPGVNPSDSYANIQELTGRMDSSTITDVLQRRLLRSYKKEDNKDVYDFVIATNMISVGVDVGRLGTMIMAGQPKSNAEYIQATSRIGRSTPGLVLCVYYPSRSRDRSHYEQFMKYHSAMYRYVEPVSLTPFSDRARDRALHALYVTLVRFGSPEYRRNQDACHFDPKSEAARNAKARILRHAAASDPEEVTEIRADLDAIERHWVERARIQDELSQRYRAADRKKNGAQPLVYIDYLDERSSLLKAHDHHDIFYVMNSMRSVDEEAGLYLWEGTQYE